jgi:outer membrane protein OmpA-like peptidoglycan-associated protein
MRKFGVILLVALLLPGLFACNWSRRDKGTAIGAGAGAVIGGVIGDKAGNTAAGAILGAVIGGAAGAYIGNYMDKQAEEMERDIEGARIERIGEGIKITFDSGILFDVSKSELRSASKENLTNLARILNKYQDTEVMIVGHTDSDGSGDYNLDLSMHRAQSVSSYLAIQAVAENRFRVMGYGEDQPVADNSTPEGKQANRRVEIAIFANDKLKGVAEKQAG